MKWLKLIFVIGLALFTGFLFAQLKEFEIREAPAPAGIALTMDHPDCAQLVINSQIMGLRFESNMAGIREQRHLPREDKYLIFITPIRQIITVKAAGFIENQLGAAFELKAKERKYFVINEQKQASSSTKGSFTLNSVPSGALIQIDGFPGFRERTPYRFKDYRAMNYELSLSLEGYDDYRYQMQILPDQEASDTITLKPNFAELVITSAPNATLYLNGVRKGNTPQSFEGVKNGLKPGEYTITLEQNRYKRIEERIYLSAGDREIKRYSPEAQFTEMIVKSNPSGSTVYLDSKNLGRTPLELLGENNAVDSGTYNLRIVPSNSNYSTLERSVRLEPGGLFSETYDHKDQSRWLSIKVNETPFEAFLNGIRNTSLERGQEVMLAGESATLKVVFKGKDSDKYPPYIKELRLLEGERHQEAVAFNPFKARVDLRSDFDDVKLKIRDKEKGKTVFEGKSESSVSLFPGSYAVSAKRKYFYDLETDIKVNHEPSQLFEFNPRFKSHKPKTALVNLIVSSGAFIALGGGAYYSWQKSEEYHTDYRAATQLSEVNRLKDAANKWDKNTQYLTAGEIAATAWLTRTVINYARIKKMEKEVKRIQRFDLRR